MLDGEIKILEGKEPNLQHKVESGVQGLIEVELSSAKCRNLMASVENKAANAAVSLVVSDMITGSVSLEQAHVEAFTADPRSVPDPTMVLQVPHDVESEHQSESVQPEGVSQSNTMEDPTIEGTMDDLFGTT